MEDNGNPNGAPTPEEKVKTNAQGNENPRGQYQYRYPQGGYYYPYQYQYHPHYHYGGWGWHYPPAAARQQKPPKRKRSSKPSAVGALLITAGILAILLGGIFSAFLINIGPWTREFDSRDFDEGVADLRGLVIYQNGSPVQDAIVTVVDSGQFAVTNSTGHYRILGISVGWHDIRVQKTGYITLIQSVDISDLTTWISIDGLEGDNVADFQMQPGSGETRIGEAVDPDAAHGGSDMGMGAIRTLGYVCIATSVIFGAITMIGGFFAYQRRNLAFVVIAGIFGMLSFGFGFSTLFSLIALVILFLCMDEFDQPKKKGGRKRRHGKKGRSRDPYNGPMDGGGRYGVVDPRYQNSYNNYYRQQPSYYQYPTYHPSRIPPGPRNY